MVKPSLREAIGQAEDELVAALANALPIADLDDFRVEPLSSAMSQTNPLGNAYLLALSTGSTNMRRPKRRSSAPRRTPSSRWL